MPEPRGWVDREAERFLNDPEKAEYGITDHQVQGLIRRVLRRAAKAAELAGEDIEDLPGVRRSKNIIAGIRMCESAAGQRIRALARTPRRKGA